MCLLSVPATVQRLVYPAGGGIPRVEHRTRSLALFEHEDMEWGWSDDHHEAFVFPMFALPLVSSADDYARSAEAHVARLKEADEAHAWPVVHGETARKERELRHSSRLASAEASVRDAVIVPEPEFETGGKPPIRRTQSIPERIRKAREQKRRRRHVDPQTAYELMAKEGLA